MHSYNNIINSTVTSALSLVHVIWSIRIVAVATINFSPARVRLLLISTDIVRARSLVET